MRLVTLAIVVAAVLFGVEAAAVQEQQLPYSGVALTPSGDPVADGLHQMEFRLYTGATASEPVWTELQLVQTRSGSYQVVLGQSRPLPLTTGQQYWLEVLCDGASLGRMPLALLPSQVETKVAARSLQELHLNPVQSAAPNGWVRAGLPTLGGATPPQPLVVNTCEECTTTFWALTGNAGTNPNNNFLGTTDNQPLIIRTNNVNRVRITTGGQIEVLNSARSVSLGEGAGISQDLTASRNNVFVGFQAGSATETGIRNVAVGSGALSQNIDGSSNTALGSNAMSTLTTGDYNTAIGYGAEVGDGLTNATAIGAFAFAGQSNTVVIGSIQGVNGATATANVGIGTTTPMNRLHVVSTADPLRLEGLQVNSALDNVLVVDASGVVKKRSLSGFVGSTAWLLTGNTLSGGEVLGSLNPQPLVLVTNNVERMRITATGEVVVQNRAPTGATKVIIQAGANQSGVNLLEWKTAGGTVLGGIDDAGNLFVNTNTTLGDAAGDTVRVNARTVELPNIPSGSAATEVLVWNVGNVEHRSASGLIGDFAWMLTGNSITSAWDGSSGNFLGTTNAQPLVIATTDTVSPQPIQFWTRNVERMRITEAGDVGIGTSTPAARLDVVNPDGGGVLRLQAVAGQTGALLEWVNELGDTLGVIDNSGLVGIGTAAPMQKLHVVGNGTVSAVFVEGGVGIGTVNPLATLHVYDEGLTGATQVVIQAGANQSGVDLLQWSDTTGNVLGRIDYAGNLFVNTNTTLGDAAGDTVRVNAGTVALPNILSGSTATEVLVWNSSDSTVERRAASGLIGDFAWMLTGNSITSAWDGSSGNFLGTTNAQPLVIATTDTVSPQPIQFWTKNVERMRITEAGDVGIGTFTPGARLHVVGTGRFDGQLTVTAGGAAITGNSTVTGTLTVSSDVSVGGNLAVAGNTTLGDAAGDTVRVNARTVELPNIPSGSAATEVLVWNVGNVEHRSASGLIGDFAWMLTGNSITSAWDGSSGNFLGTTNAQPLVIATTDTVSPQPIQFWTKNVERMRITEAGDVGIGTSTPAARLDVVNPDGGGVLRLQAVAGQTGALLEWVNELGDTLGVIDNSGLVGIGTAAPMQKLHVVGNGTVSAVFVEGGVGIGTVNPLATLHVYDEGLTGATQVVIQAGANQSGVDLLQWRNNSGDTLGVIRPEGSVVLFYDPPTRQAFFAVADPSGVPLIGIGPNPTGWGVGVYEPNAPYGDLRAGMGKVSGEWRMGVGDLGTESGVLLSWATTGTPNERRIVVANGDLGNPVFLVDREGDVTVAGNTTLGDAAGDTVRVNARTVELPNIPSGSTATEVLVWKSSDSTVERRAASGLISDFAWMLTGNSITSAWDGLSGNFLGTRNAQPLVIATTDTTTPQPIQFWTRNVERMRITEAGEVVVQNRAPNGATKVIIQAGANQAGGNLLEWQDNAGNVLGRIDGAGNLFVNTNTTLGDAAGDTVRVNARTVELPNIPSGSTATEVLVWNVGNVEHRSASGLIGDFAWMLTGNSITSAWDGSSGNFLGTTNARPLVIATTDTTTPQPIQFWTRNVERVRITATGDVGIGTFTPGARLHVVGTGRFDGQLTVTAGGAAITGNSTVTGTLTVSSDVSVGGNLAVAGNTTLGDAAGDTVRVNARTVELPNIPSGSTATEVLVWNVGNVEHRSASGLIGDFAWMLTGNSITSAWDGSSGNFLGTTNARPLVIATTDTTTPQPIQFWTRNVERVRITATGDVGIGTFTPGARLHVVGTGRFDGQLTVTAGGAAITGNSTVTGTLTVSSDVSVGGNLAVAGNTTLGDAAGDTVRVNARTVELPNIPSGSTATEVLVWNVGNVEHRSASGLIGDFAWMLTGNSITSAWDGSSGNFLGTTNARPLVIATTDTTTPQPIQFWTRNVERVRITATGDVGIGTFTPGARLHVVGTGRFDGQLTVTAGGAAITGNSTVTGTLTVSSDVSVGGNLAVAGNTTLGDAAGDTVRVNARTVELPNIPSGSTATEVLVWNVGNVEHRSASGLIGDFAWMLTGNSITSAWDGSSGNFLGTTNARPLVIATTDTTTPQPIQFWTRNVERVRITATGDVGIGTFTPGARLHVVGTGRFDGQLTVTAGGAAITGNSTVTGTLTVSSDVSVGGNLAVAGNTTLGDAAGDTVRVNARTVELPNIPSGSTATEVLVWNVGNVEHRSASGLIGDFAWMLTAACCGDGAL
jgi:adenylosuccinate synthase